MRASSVAAVAASKPTAREGLQQEASCGVRFFAPETDMIFGDGVGASLVL